jgi:Tol biopolymer transport system component
MTHTPSLRRCGLSALLFVALHAHTAAQTGSTFLVPPLTGGFPAHATAPVVNKDGRYVCFLSASEGGSSPPGVTQVYRHDVVAGTTTRVGPLGNFPAQDVRISSDGMKVVFASNASNLTADDTDTDSDVFLFDVATGVTTLVSVNDDGSPIAGDGYICQLCSITPTADRVVFCVTGQVVVENSNVVFGKQVYMRLIPQGVTQHVSHVVGVKFANTAVDQITASVDATGTIVAFTGRHPSVVAPNLAIHRKNLSSGEILTLANGATAEAPSISADGTTIVYSTAAATSSTDTNGVSDVYSWYASIFSGDLLSTNATGDVTLPSFCRADVALSGDGQYATFWSAADNLVPNDNNAVTDVFVRRIQQLTATSLRRHSVGSQGVEGDAASLTPAIAAEGRFLVFASEATNLGGDTAGVDDVFLHDRLQVSAPGCPPNTARLDLASASTANGSSVTFTVALGVLTSSHTILYVGAPGFSSSGCGIPLPGIGDLLLSPSPTPFAVTWVQGPGPTQQLTCTIPNDPALIDVQLFLQAWLAGSQGGSSVYELTNAIGVLVQ